MTSQKLRQIAIKKAQLLIERKIGDVFRLEGIQMKLTRGLPLLAENQVYLNGLILENFSTEEVDAIVKEVESISLEKSEFSQENFLYCICCGKAKRKLDGGGMCNECFRDYRLKLSKFLTKPIGNMPFF